MISADLALAALINRSAVAYQTNVPAFITYQEHTHVIGANRSEDINRSVAVRVPDDYAVMQDLPNGAVRLGSAFPIIPHFDPFSTFSFSYFANLKRIDITFKPGDPYQFTIPAQDSNVDMLVAYFPYYAPRYAPDSTAEAVHLTIGPTPRLGNNTFYPSDVKEDPQTHLPAHVEMRVTGSDMVISLDYGMVQNHWVITHGTFSATQHVAIMTFKVDADVTYDQFAFPETAPNEKLASPPSATPAPSPTA